MIERERERSSREGIYMRIGAHLSELEFSRNVGGQTVFVRCRKERIIRLGGGARATLTDRSGISARRSEKRKDGDPRWWISPSRYGAETKEQTARDLRFRRVHFAYLSIFSPPPLPLVISPKGESRAKTRPFVTVVNRTPRPHSDRAIALLMSPPWEISKIWPQRSIWRSWGARSV